MAECELSFLERQVLRDRVGTESELAARFTLWNEDRNQRNKRIDGEIQNAGRSGQNCDDYISRFI